MSEHPTALSTQIPGVDGEIILSDHRVIDTIREILEKNARNYVPGHKIVQGVSPGVNNITGEEGYKVRLDTLEILYNPDNDTIQIGHREGVDKKIPDIRLAVGQANMILYRTQQSSKARISMLMIGDGLGDRIIIENASQLQG